MKNYLVLATLLVGCGGGGVSGSKKLSELSQSEVTDLCQELVDDFPERTVDCGNGLTLTIGWAAADCADEGPAPATCTATVSDVRECEGDFYGMTDAQICMSESLPASCAALEGCGG